MSSSRPISGALVGRDFARSRPIGTGLRSGLLGWLILVSCVCALGLAALSLRSSAEFARERRNLHRAPSAL